jgi:ribosomal protein S9
MFLWLRFHHAPFDATGVKITQQAKTACGADVTGRISTNGSAGTVSYQWVFKPQTQAPQPLSQSVTAGQHDVYVTVAVQGQGHGSAAQMVTLDVLGPGGGTASTVVSISC